MFLYKIVGDRVEVEDGASHRILVAHAEHPQVYLLREVRCIGLAADTAPEERQQGAAVLGKQPLDQRWFRVRRRHRERIPPSLYESRNPVLTTRICGSDSGACRSSIDRAVPGRA